MSHNICIDPSSVSMYDSNQVANIVTGNSRVQLLKPDGNRIAFWLSISGTINMVSTDTLQVGCFVNGVFQCFNSVNTVESDFYMSILQYGSIIQGEVWSVNSNASQQVSVGTLTRPRRE